MTNTISPLTSAELADLKADTRDPYRLFPSSTILRLIDMIERHRGLLALILHGIRKGNIEDQTLLLPCAPDATERPMKALSEMLEEALATTAPQSADEKEKP